MSIRLKDESALKPDQGKEADFEVEDNPFAYSPGQLGKMFNPKSLSAFYQLGGLAGLEKGLRTNRNTGLSPDERHPEARNEACPCHKSHQDPQLIFDVTFINPDAERFLFPIAAHSGCDCNAAGRAKVMRFPRDA